jgi:hypothetical protein
MYRGPAVQIPHSQERVEIGFPLRNMTRDTIVFMADAFVASSHRIRVRRTDEQKDHRVLVPPQKKRPPNHIGSRFRGFLDGRRLGILHIGFFQQFALVEIVFLDLIDEAGAADAELFGQPRFVPAGAL